MVVIEMFSETGLVFDDDVIRIPLVTVFRLVVDPLSGVSLI